uniref:protein-tyrosine-phosphatase n=1 Tax=Phallusia mammillata TaxID=59560 RepID=A0A6F9D880_9ASCI|nr:M-phase inducer phosphatase 1 [Phallusia mammillata]
MTDSGFSSAASNRSVPSLVKPSLLNPFIPPQGTNQVEDKENHPSSTGGLSGLPKPCAYFSSTNNRPVIPNRLLYGRNHGGYSPGMYSPKEMSPMSSLAFDFRELNTRWEMMERQETSDTPRKRLSLSSVSSVDSPLASSLGQPSPAGALSFTSPLVNVSQYSEGCFSDAASPLVEGRLALRERDDNICEPLALSSGSKKLRRFKSVPASKSRFRLHAIGNECTGKENSPVLQSKKQVYSQRRGSFEMSPMATSPAPLSSRRRPSGLLMSPNMTSSPMVPHFSSSSSSAFSAVNHVEPQIEEEPELRVSPRDESSTPEKSVVPGSIASLTAGNVMAPRPSSSVPFYRAKSSPCFLSDAAVPHIRANKRSLDSSVNTSLACASKRVKCSESLLESRSTRRKMAFGAKERKTKSADAAFFSCSPISSLKASFRPISAPAQMFCADDDAPLSHSRLCSTNDSDAEDDAMEMSSDPEHFLEEIINENARDCTVDATGSDQAPSGLHGLISGPLLLNDSNKDSDDSFANSLPKPRSLFRSPSAPPVVASRRALHAIKRAEQRAEDSNTPLGTVRSRSAILQESVPEVASPCAMTMTNSAMTMTSLESDDEHNASLNRSRSYNELDVMRAVEVGCSDPNLIGDFSRVCSLDTVQGKHQDLKYITPETLISLVNNERDCCYEVIDCRYPYEYEGGHVQGANHIWQEEQLYKRYFQNSKPLWACQKSGNYKPPVLVFYCEFSSERGPRMARALRSKDREVNRYPHLHYPEVYVLKDGYKNFFAGTENKNYCEPRSYRPMAHEDYQRELRTCRVKSKTWHGERTKHNLYNRLKHL